MKLYGFNGKGTGRMGASVFAIRKGQQIVRAYNPVVTNPNTQAQVAQRAKFKLLSQLGAVVAKALAFVTVGAGASQRNAFMKAVMPAVSASGSAAVIDMSGVRLTDGSEEFLGNIVMQPDGISLEGANDWDGIGYAVITRPAVGRMSGFSGFSNDTGAAFPAVIPSALFDKSQALVYAWRFRDAAARASYQDIYVSDDTELSLDFARMVAKGDIITSRTYIATKQE